MSVRLHIRGRLYQELSRKAARAAVRFYGWSQWAHRLAARFQKKAENFFQQVKERAE
ncbi:MAG: hypothetical protein AAGI09_11970 [Pseudomonadota bacterium]